MPNGNLPEPPRKFTTTFESHPPSGEFWEDSLLSRSVRLLARSCRTLANACSEDKTSAPVGILSLNENNRVALGEIVTVPLASGQYWQVIPGVVDRTEAREETKNDRPDYYEARDNGRHPRCFRYGGGQRHVGEDKKEEGDRKYGQKAPDYERSPLGSGIWERSSVVKTDRRATENLVPFTDRLYVNTRLKDSGIKIVMHNSMIPRENFQCATLDLFINLGKTFTRHTQNVHTLRPRYRVLGESTGRIGRCFPRSRQRRWFLQGWSGNDLSVRPETWHP